MAPRRSGKWWIVAAMSVPLFILTVDINGVIVALPDIGLDLDASTTSLQWVMNAYLLAFASLLLPIGRVADVVGRRRVLIVGTTVFGLASLSNGLAPNELVLIIGRAVQGAGAAMFFATSLSIVSNAFSAEERGRGIGIWTAVGASGAAAGPLIGGVLTELLSWRWFFFVNVPIAVAAVVLILLVVEESRDESAGGRIDVPGFLASTAGVVALVLGIQESDNQGWGSPLVLGLLAAAVVLLVAFVVVERHVKNPLFDLDLFRNRNFVSSNIVGALQNYTFFGISFFLTLYLQNVLGLTAGETGLMFLAVTGPFVAASPFMGKAYNTLGGRWGMFIGIALCAVSAAMLTALEVDSDLLIVVAAFVVLGIGSAFGYNISTTAGMSSIEEDKAGAASGILSSTRFVGSALGLAITGAVFKVVEEDRLDQELTDQVPALTAAQREEVEGLLSGSPQAAAELSELGADAAARVEDVVQAVFIPSLSAAMAALAITVGIGSLAAFLYREPS